MTAVQVANQPVQGGLPDLGSLQVRDRLSSPAFRGFVTTAEYLNFSVEERTRLLGAMPSATYHRYVAKGAPTLARDQLERISLLFGITKGLRLLFSEDDMGRRWLKASNDDAPFAGFSPLDYMLQGSIAHLFAVRRYIDAWRGVWP